MRAITHLHTPALVRAHIVHTRHAPKAHRFSYELHYLWHELEQLPTFCATTPACSWNGFNALSMHASDLLHPGNRQKNSRFKTHAASAFDDAHIRASIAAELQHAHNYRLNAERIWLLTMPRSFGYGFNPVTFYFVFPAAETEVAASHTPLFIIADIENTPWRQRQAYVLDNRASSSHSSHSSKLNAKRARNSAEPTTTEYFNFDKTFHVSPFMPLDLEYQWHFKCSAKGINIHMRLVKDQQRLFDAYMHNAFFALESVSKPLAWVYGLHSAKAHLAIYYQALKLALKRLPFYSHPDKAQNNAS